jgi:hypothetical protein
MTSNLGDEIRSAFRQAGLDELNDDMLSNCESYCQNQHPISRYKQPSYSVTVDHPCIAEGSS